MSFHKWALGTMLSTRNMKIFTKMNMRNVCVCVCVHARARLVAHLESYLTLCNPMDCSPPDSSVHGGSPGKNTGVGCPPPGNLLNLGIEPRSPSLQVDSLLSEPPGKPYEKFTLSDGGADL